MSPLTSMSGYFSAIVLVQLAAVLVVNRYTEAEALQCFETSETCDKLTCLNKEPESPSAPQAEPCKRLHELVQEDLDKTVQDIGTSLLGGGQPNPNDIVLVGEFQTVQSKVHAKVKESENSAGNQTLCLMGQAVITAKLSSRTVQKTHILRGCATDEPRCQDINEKSSSGKITFTMKLCTTDGDSSNKMSAKLDADGSPGGEKGDDKGTNGASKLFLSPTHLLIGAVFLAKNLLNLRP